MPHDPPEHNYRPLPDFLTIKKSEIDGLGLFATKQIFGRACLGLSHLEYIINEEKGLSQIYRTPLGGFVNHSEDPNCIKVKHKHVWYLETLRNIEPGEELTLKYTFYSPCEESSK